MIARMTHKVWIRIFSNTYNALVIIVPLRVFSTECASILKSFISLRVTSSSISATTTFTTNLSNRANPRSYIIIGDTLSNFITNFGTTAGLICRVTVRDT